MWPYLTSDLPGIGGEIKRHDEDFIVEELPLYAASGSGTHTYLLIEKRGLTTLEAVGQIARALGKHPPDIGYAGLKDAHGVTRQTLSVEHVATEQVAALSLPRVRVLKVSRHENKIKLGHLAGNRFTIRIRGVGSDALGRTSAILEVLGARGVPNYFGRQRFGVRGDNAAIGQAVLRGEYEEAIALFLGRPGEADHGPVRRARELFDAGQVAEAARAWPGGFREQQRLCLTLKKGNADALRAWRTVNHTLRRLFLSAWQSALFNEVLAERIGGLDRLETGDLAWLHRNGKCFLVQDADAEQPRCTAGEISPTGPLFGPRMSWPEGEPGAQEQRIFEASRVTLDRRRTADGAPVAGARRPLRVPLGEADLSAGTDEHGTYLEVRFTLPAGAYATCVTRELCKGNE
ncbi:MAG TPA: tRNA pseudouridine(13) synthase TruD [Phycisphaerae bacterium]|nr:tRNA pseudouridine(13) synthase TruD [Phycisphaerae bacterium]HNU45294.1 tRNA pseudouridine(13) synthase TruD [Phycisphaerae bacterium]